MHVISQQSLAADAARRWGVQYQHEGRDDDPQNEHDTGTLRTYRALLALGPHPSPADVNRVIGNDSWTHVRCDECRSTSPEITAIVQLGEEPDYESSTAGVCEKCLVAALAAIRGTAPRRDRMAESIAAQIEGCNVEPR